MIYLSNDQQSSPRKMIVMVPMVKRIIEKRLNANIHDNNHHNIINNNNFNTNININSESFITIRMTVMIKIRVK